MIATMKCVYDRMVCNILFITAWSFLRTAEQTKGKKSAKRIGVSDLSVTT